MSKNSKDLEIVSKLAQEIASNNEPSKEEPSVIDEPSKKQPNEFEETENNVVQNQTSDIRNIKKRKSNKNKPTPTLKDIAAKRQNQNLAERKALLVILAVLLGIQLLFMNVVVLFIILWSIFDWTIFRELNTDVLKCVLDFTKYYVTAVLVELLGGIIYIVHRVFSDKN